MTLFNKTKLLTLYYTTQFKLETISYQLVRSTVDAVVPSRPEDGETFLPYFKPNPWELVLVGHLAGCHAVRTPPVTGSYQQGTAAAPALIRSAPQAACLYSANCLYFHQYL